MVVEALRLIFVVAVVLGTNRLAAARPGVFGRSEVAILLVTGLGAAFSYVIGGVVARGIERAMRGAEERLAQHHASEIIAATLGLLIGGVIAALVTFPIVIFVEPTYVAYSLAAFVAIVVVTFATRLAVRKRLELFGVLGVAPSVEPNTGGCLLDSSAAIDGRVLALYKAGLLPRPICVPAFVIWEMQGIADSEDPLRRRRGRRGLDLLRSLREAGAEVRVLDEDPVASTDADTKLVVVARRRGLPIVTSDTNLAHAAELQGIGVLNLHALAELLRPPMMPGETATVRIVRAGRERGQGVAYLDDGSMVVVEAAEGLINTEVEVEVTSVLQNDMGRMLFAKLPDAPPLLEAN
jgi:uncharacterized protein YacL